MLYTTKEIAEMYGGEQNNVTPYMITHTWIPNRTKTCKRKRQWIFIPQRMGRRIFRIQYSNKKK